MKHLRNEESYPHRADFLRVGGKLELGENIPPGAFAHLRTWNKTFVVAKAAYQDFDDVLKEMDSQAKRFFERQNAT